MRRLAIVVLVLAAAVPASAQARAPHCALRYTELEVARSSRAVVLERSYPSPRLTGCSLRTGRRRTINTRGASYVSLYGTTVAYSALAGNANDMRGFVYVDDAVHAGRGRLVTDAGGYELYREVAAGPDGLVAAVKLAERGMELQLVAPYQGRIDAAGAIAGPHFTGHVLTWLHDGIERSAPVAPTSPCSTAIDGSTLAVAVQSLGPPLSVCSVANGAVRTLDGPFVPFFESHQLVSGGEWVAVLTAADQISTLDARDGARETIAAGGQVTDLAIDEHGSVAWGRDDAGRPSVWVHDAGGTREVDPGPAGEPVFDHSTLWWSHGGAAGEASLSTTVQP